MELRVEDDGVGFDVEAYRAAAPLSRGFGLDNARERAELSDGELIVELQRGRGTRVQAVWRLPAAESLALAQEG